MEYAKSIGAYLQSKGAQHRCVLMLYPLETLNFIKGLLLLIFIFCFTYVI